MPSAAATGDSTAALQKGLFEEEANHDLNAAIQAYQSVIKAFDQDRKLAATAVFRLGECYRKQGNTNEANVQYERVIREFSDQTPLVALSRSYLAASGQTADIPFIGSAPSTSDEAQELQRIKAMIKDSPDLINARDFSGATPLYHAAQKGQLAVATFLLDNGAEVNARDNNNATPLHVATVGGHKAMVELLLAHQADVQAMQNDADAPTALHVAARSGFRSILELLLTHGAQVNAKGSSGATPLHMAAANGFKAIAEVLIQKGAEVNLVTSKVHSPVWHGDARGTPLHIAAAGDAAMAGLLLDHKADPNAKLEDGRTPLHIAASFGAEKIARLLIEHGSDINARTIEGWTPLAFAVSRNSEPAAEVLLQSKADPNIPLSLGNDHRTPLYLAVANRNIPLVSVLLKYGADPNVEDEAEHQTPLSWAARNHLEEIASLLLDAKANPNIHDRAGQTPLHWAVVDPGTVKKLLVANAPVNAKDNQGHTPLHWAAGAGLKASAELLLAHGAGINAQDNAGNTPLHFAVLAGRAEMVNFLLSKGADPNVVNKDSQTPLNWTKRSPGVTAFTFQLGNNSSFLVPVSTGRPTLAASPTFLAGGTGGTGEEMASALRSHGALADLPHLDRIEVSRLIADFNAPVFFKGTNDWNQFTALEVLGVQYGLLSGNPEGEGSDYDTKSVWVNSIKHLSFPDLADLHIRTPSSDLKTWQERKLNLTPVLQSGDCSTDVPLAWGEVLEVPEADHPLNEGWQGFSNPELSNLVKCLSRKVTVVINGHANKIEIGPEVQFGPGFPLAPGTSIALNVHTRMPLWLKPALRHSNLLLASSDLSRVKVTRRDPETGRKRELVLDCSDGKPAPPLWLRDEDIVEVPERP